jgi:hypothetical protein
MLVKGNRYHGPTTRRMAAGMSLGEGSQRRQREGNSWEHSLGSTHTSNLLCSLLGETTVALNLR